MAEIGKPQRRIIVEPLEMPIETPREEPTRREEEAPIETPDRERELEPVGA